MPPEILSAGLPMLAKAVCTARGEVGALRNLVGGRGMPERVSRIVEKATVGAGSVNDPTWTGTDSDYRILVSAFVESLRTRSVFARMLDDGAFKRVPFGTRAMIATLGATGYIIGEGQPTPLSRVSVSAPYLEPRKAAAIIVVSDELANSQSAAAQSLFTRELRSAVSDVIDEDFLASIVDSGTPQFISGDVTATAAKQDLRSLLGAVNTVGGDARLYWVGSPDVATMASTLPTDDGGDAFPGMTPQGGAMVGLPFLVANVAAGTLYLIDAGGFVAEMDTITLDSSQHVSLEMTDTPAADAATGAATQLVSMFQTNSTALLCKVWFGLEQLREGSVARLTGIEWGEPAGSP